MAPISQEPELRGATNIIIIIKHNREQGCAKVIIRETTEDVWWKCNLE